MSLTYPILNDILVEKVDNLSNQIQNLYNRLDNQVTKFEVSKADVDDIMCKQDVKIGLIHSLFKHYKESMNSDLNSDSEQVNINIIKSEYNNLLGKLNNSLNKSINEHNNKIILKLNNRYDELKLYLDNSIKRLTENLSTDKIIKTQADIIYRLNSLEKKYILLEKQSTNKYNQNEKSINSLDTTQSSDSDSESGNTNNWIQVSRKYTIKKLEN
jgi:hypothetical protein